MPAVRVTFLSIQAQDFIEDAAESVSMMSDSGEIPEHSSSGLH